MRTPLRKSHGKMTFVLYNEPNSCRGACLYCFSVKGLTKSTTLNEDTILAKSSNWDGKIQLSERFKLYGISKGTGIKCDLAVKGDSFACHDYDYLRNYTKQIYNFLNNDNSVSLRVASLKQSNAPDRCVTFKVETRPDIITTESCHLFAELGVTTVELGVQSLDDNLLSYNERGHNTDDIKKATNLLRKFGFEICYQVMVGLPGSNKEIDKELITKKLWKEDYSPDALKIYPCLLLKKEIAKQNKLRNKYSNGLWKPLNNLEYLELLTECYPKIPRFVHINKIQRIIPESKIEAGPSVEIDRNTFSSISKCLWQRSIAQKNIDLESNFQDYEIIYYNQGKKRFCFEALYNDDIVLGYGRCDIIMEKSAIIRDIRVLGNMMPIGSKNNDRKGCQHIGIGTSILANIELKAAREKIDSIFVKPSYGTKDWFIKRGYEAVNMFYLAKSLRYNETNKQKTKNEFRMVLNNLGIKPTHNTQYNKLGRKC